MSQQQQNVPTDEQLRLARRNAAAISLRARKEPEKAERLIASHARQDARRERNISGVLNGLVS